MSFSLATGIKLIISIKTVAYDQRSSVILNLYSLIGCPIGESISKLLKVTTGISKRTSNKELQALQEA